jgi:alpha-tubulin suppressor-like RCC1 family protein
MPSPEVVTNYNDSDGVDLGKKLISKDYLISVYPQIADQLITPELWVWGRNSYASSGPLGTNDTTDRLTPVTTTAGGSNWKYVSGGAVATLSAGIKTDGTLWVWGWNVHGQLGTNDGTIRLTPVTTFAGGTNWKQVYVSYLFCSAIKTDGTLWTWGGNDYGQLGTNDGTYRYTPVTTFAGGTNWKQGSSGGYHCAAIKTDGTLWTWGYNAYGNLGTNDTTNRSTPVTTFAGGTNWKQVSSGADHCAAIKTDGTLWTWGRNFAGKLGTNDTTHRSTPVTTFAGGTNWKQVSCNYFQTSAIKTDGTLWLWGYNAYGGLGTNDTTDRATPVTTFAGGTNWKQVGTGGFATAAIKTDGTLWTWGRGVYGKLGINDDTSRYTPVTTFAGGTNWKQVGGGINHIAAIKTSDDLIGI